MANPYDKDLEDQTALYAGSTNGTAYDVSRFARMSIVLDVTDITGAPTSLDVKLQHSADGTNYGDFKTGVAFTQVTSSTGTETIRLGAVGLKYVRTVSAIVGGTASKHYTFTVKAVGNQ